MKDKPRYIYALIDPDTRKVRYVGQTADWQKRLAQHMSTPGGTESKREWIQSLKDRGKRPDIILLDKCSRWFAAYDCESIWMTSLEAAGHPLTNHIYRINRLRSGRVLVKYYY